jgi:hypothetical protein
MSETTILSYSRDAQTYFTSCSALTVSIMQITVVKSLQIMLACRAGTGAYRNIGIVPVAERSPNGANLA